MAVTDEELAKLEKEISTKEEAPPPGKPPEEPTPPIESASSEPGATPEPPQQEEFNAAEWTKKKGWKTPEDAAKSFRDLEMSFHEKTVENARLREAAANPPAYTPWPQYPQGYAPPPPAYAPPPNPYAPPVRTPTEEQVAASYGMTPEDFRRVLAVSRDMAEVQARAMSSEFNRWKEEVSKTNEKNSDMTSVMGDPAFHRPEVQYEMHELFNKNPQLWNERRPLGTALEKALSNIARRNLNSGVSRPSEMGLPTAPPVTAGSGGASGSLPGKRGIGSMPSVRDMQNKSPEEIEKLLRSAGAFRTYQDMA